MHLARMNSVGVDEIFWIATETRKRLGPNGFMTSIWRGSAPKTQLFAKNV